MDEFGWLTQAERDMTQQQLHERRTLHYHFQTISNGAQQVILNFQPLSDSIQQMRFSFEALMDEFHIWDEAV
jgi:hypothetical protein